MKKLRFIGFYAGIMLLILSLTLIYVQGKNLLSIPPAGGYEDEGVYGFQPYQVLPMQVESTATGKYKRLNPTRTVYVIEYLAIDGSGYKWRQEASSEEGGRKTVAAGKTIERRVLRIPAENTYITVEPEQTAEGYTAELRRQYIWMIGLSVLYIIGYVIVWILYKRKKAKPAYHSG